MMLVMNCQNDFPTKLKILFFISEDWYFWSHRRSIAIEAIRRGYEVVLVSRVNELQEEIEQLGIKLIPSRLVRKSVNPFGELKTLLELIRIYRQEKPDIVHHVALKPIIYGTLAARITNIPGIVNAFGGLGHLFSSSNWRTRFLKNLFILILRLTLNNDRIRIILQNPVDFQRLIKKKVVDGDKLKLIRGAGADLGYFIPTEEPEGTPVLVYAGRLLWSKGVGDFVHALEIIKDQEIDFRAVLIGKPDPDNPESIPINKLEKWEEKGLIEWKGFREDMALELSSATMIVLPTYYGEGVPKILIEAAAASRPIITTKIPGCMEIVKDNWNGLLIPPHKPEELARAICKLINDKDLRQEMGKNGRMLVEKEFSEEIVLEQTFSLYEELGL
ncbi:MAG TPA: glycosyltransferase family 1 protein [Chloroflexi bacterium]|nr:glycosyltransferase family 1 protein [Chloroflexota bacterium]